ncbi:hypothetical protein CW740_11545 [Kangiella profundi]|uniref:Uncharacterized protein n=2 Tax=Kangiella profundi TaxID=1561924 RepID=A0A2K9B4L6_9GAMM|nr:hypothetical protein CW740_11545 [Kangiella profundi]GGE94888.1 hypothetical protein GCM10011356_06010 [Kangiella profundi]
MLVDAKHVEPDDTRQSQEVSEELCKAVKNYDDWQLYHDQWVSEAFDLERFQWQASKGYPVKESRFYERTDYDKYSTETLMRLAQEGDKAANLELAQRHYYFRSGKVSDAEHFCYMAVVDGFSAMTSCMISSYGEKVARQMAKDQGQSSERQLKLRLKLLGWTQISQDFDDVFAQQFAEILKPGYQRNDITDAMIKDAAQSIREELKLARQKRKEYKETLTFDVKQEMPELWRILENNQQNESMINSCFKESQYATQ